MNLRKRAAVTALAAASVVVLVAGPAAASDGRAVATYNGTTKAIGTYDDLTDNLCVQIVNSGSGATASATIRPVDGIGKSYDVPTRGNSTACTGNLSIPEDQYYYLTVQWHSADGTVHVYSAADRFYT